MQRLKTLIFDRFHILFTLFAAFGVCLILLMIRLKLSQSYFFLFLVWNIFLAALPYALTFYLSSKQRLGKYQLMAWFGLWLLFLPNAPYIVTDLIHLQHFKASFIVLDTVLIVAYALCGLLFYFLSLRDMELLLKVHFSDKICSFTIFLIPFLMGFGVYLGRFLRWNSWDVVQRPLILLQDMWEIVIYPMEHQLAWVMTFSFGIVLILGYYGFKRIRFLN